MYVRCAKSTVFRNLFKKIFRNSKEKGEKIKIKESLGKRSPVQIHSGTNLVIELWFLGLLAANQPRQNAACEVIQMKLLSGLKERIF